jgi:hypothetical protein
MRIVISTVLATALLALSACAPPPLKEYAYPAWGFAASFPGQPAATDTPTSADGVHPHTLQLESKVGGHDFVVAATDASASTKSDDEILSEVPAAIAQGIGGTVTSTTYVATGQVVGREVLIDKPGQQTMRMRIYVSGKRLYQVGAQSMLGPQDPEIVEFLDSFHLLGK